MITSVDDLNKVPSKISTGELSVHDAIEELSKYILLNKALFGLKKLEEDFADEIIVHFIEKGEVIFNKFNEISGTFFNYLYSYIKNLVYTKSRIKARNAMIDSYTTNQSIISYPEIVESYKKINYKVVEDYHIPYAANKVSSTALKSGFKIPCVKESDSAHHKLILSHVKAEKKAILVISLKSAYFLNDAKIRQISSFCEIQHEDFCTIIQEIKDELMPRIERKRALEEKRNNLYYTYCKFLTQSSNPNWSEEKKKLYYKKAQDAKYKLDKINEKLSKGKINIRPNNKLIAEILGICERQISYYIKYAKSSESLQKFVKNNLA